MPSHAASEVARLLDPTLRANGFVRHGHNWFRYNGESISLLNVQRSRLSQVAYVNLGTYFYRYGKLQKPKLVECHVDTGLNSVVPHPLRVIALLDLTSYISSEVRGDELGEIVRSYALPWFDRMMSLESARSFLASNPTAAHVAPIARAELISSQQTSAK
jgi:hypothetical protein